MAEIEATCFGENVQATEEAEIGEEIENTNADQDEETKTEKITQNVGE